MSKKRSDAALKDGPEPTGDPEASQVGADTAAPPAPDPVPAPAPLPQMAGPVGGAVGRELGGPASPPAPPEAFGGPAPAPAVSIPIALTIKLVQGSLTEVESPVAVAGRYKGTSPAGAIGQFDVKLGSWITQAIDLGMIGSNLGQLFFIPIPRNRSIAPNGLILAGMGEPGHFTHDDLRYLMTNVAYAIKAIGHNAFTSVVIGSGAGGFSKDRAIRAAIDGACDALERFPDTGPRAIEVAFVEEDAEQFNLTREALVGMVAKEIRTNLTVAFDPPPEAKSVTAPTSQVASSPDAEPVVATTRITITATAASDIGRDALAAAGPIPRPANLVFQYAALAETAVIPVRQVTVQAYFARRLPERLKKVTNRLDQENYGKLLANYLLPEDFRRVIEDGETLTLVLDPDTAVYPWEMAAFRSPQGTVILGPDFELTRQFRTLSSTVPGIAPALNDSLKILVIADPAPGVYHLKGARAEGLKVVEVLKSVKEVWKEKLKLQVHVRIGSPDARSDAAFASTLDELGRSSAVVASADTCDALEILKLLLTEQFDIVHFAGHGIFNPANGSEGWVLDGDCILSANEIFKVRQVPRLVVANACYSAKTNEPDTAIADLIGAVPVVRQQVSLAEAFFQRGIQNYIGAGWAVDDGQALDLAVAFYRHALGVGTKGNRIYTSPPATLGRALAKARRLLLNQGGGTTWAAYQHYGQVTAKLLAFKNEDTAPDS
jgi:hypothetical protein